MLRILTIWFIKGGYPPLLLSVVKMDYKDMWLTLKVMLNEEQDLTFNRLQESVKCRDYSECIKLDTKYDVYEYILKTMRTIEKRLNETE